MTVVLLVPDGVGARNLLLGPFVRQLRRHAPVAVLHDLPEALLPAYEAAGGVPLAWHPLLRDGTGARDRLAAFLGTAIARAHMRHVNTRAMRRKLARPPRDRRLARRVRSRAARLLGEAAASPGGIAALLRAQHAAVAAGARVARYEALFASLRPSIVCSSQQRAPIVLPAVLAARRLGIPTATFVFSWDNLTTKERIAAPFDHALVWSPRMAAELRRTHPEYRAARVHVVGSPQFDLHADASLLRSRAAFCASLGIDPARPIVCYSGGDTGTCPDDAHHLRLLLELVRDGRLRARPQVVLRPSPVDDGRRYEAVRRDHPELCVAAPAWVHARPGDWSRVAPLPDDPALLANLAHHAAVNVNVASTMTLDFALHDRPVVNVAFDATRPPPLGAPLADLYYRDDHYRPVVELGAARLARTPDELAQHVDAYLADPSLDREGRRRLVALQLAVSPGAAAARAVEALATIAGLSASDVPDAPHAPAAVPVRAPEAVAPRPVVEVPS